MKKLIIVLALALTSCANVEQNPDLRKSTYDEVVANAKDSVLVYQTKTQIYVVKRSKIVYEGDLDESIGMPIWLSLILFIAGVAFGVKLSEL